MKLFDFLKFVTEQKMKFSIKGFFGKCDQVCISLKESVMENFIFCAVRVYEIRSAFHLPTRN